jgi:hypothetical protein
VVQCLALGATSTGAPLSDFIFNSCLQNRLTRTRRVKRDVKSYARISFSRVPEAFFVVGYTFDSTVVSRQRQEKCANPHRVGNKELYGLPRLNFISLHDIESISPSSANFFSSLSQQALDPFLRVTWSISAMVACRLQAVASGK